MIRAIPILGLLLWFPLASNAAERGPLYHEDSKSYFELRDDNDGGYWMAARVNAEKSVYKGRRGRLAIVSSPQVHSFLERNWELREESWIGLRYWCKPKILQWTNRSQLESKDFKIWHHRWYRHEDTKCGQEGSLSSITGFMPVYYLPQARGFLWQAAGAAKGFQYYFVEYPGRDNAKPD